MIRIIRATFTHWHANEPGRQGAVVSFYALTSLAPFVLILITILSFFFKDSAVIFYARLQGILGTESANFIHSLLSGPTHIGSTVPTIAIALLTLFISSIAMLAAVKYSLDKILEYKEPERVHPSLFHSIAHSVREKLIVFSLIPLIALLFGVSLSMTIIIHGIGDVGVQLFPALFPILQIIDPMLSFFSSVILFFLLLRILPERKLPAQELLLGAGVTAILFLFGEFVIGYYLGHVANLSLYGAAGSLVAILLFIFYSAQILFIGASFTYVYSKHYGMLSRPSHS